MGAGKTTVGADVANRLQRPFCDIDWAIESQAQATVTEIFSEQGEPAFRDLEERLTLKALRSRSASVIALGGGTPGSAAVREELARTALTVQLEVDVDEAWRRSAETGRPLARDEAAFRRLYEERQPAYAAARDAVARDADDVVLASGGVHVAIGAVELLAELVPGDGAVALVADARVAGIHGAAAQVALGSRVTGAHELPVGEDAKSVAATSRLWNELSLDRGGTLVALGGGCTTDAAGFAAATYLRGVRWVPVPTTVVGQVDAAIGGKTGINLSHGKNLVGAFHWPVRTVIDPALLETLPEQERKEGMAEVVKTGLLAGEPFWELPEPELVRRCAAFKTAVCLRDPLDRGPRAILNLGHTFAHALEAAADFDLAHGRAVALGLLAALRLSGAATDVVEEVLRPEPVRVDRERAWAALQRDKKVVDGRVRLVLLPQPGDPIHGAELPADDVRRQLDALIAD